MSTDREPDRVGSLGGVPQIPEKIHELTVGQLSARSGAAVSA
ncbi:redox-sensitive transcriptional activator SoxR, partial [Streptomyces broussonetiae]